MEHEFEKGFTAINPLDVVSRLRPGTLQLTVKREVSPGELHAALDRILELHGCQACGLNGLDIVFRHSLPINQLFGDLKNIASIEQVGF